MHSCTTSHVTQQKCYFTFPQEMKMILSLWQEPIYKWSQCLGPKPKQSVICDHLHQNVWEHDLKCFIGSLQTWELESPLCFCLLCVKVQQDSVWWTKTKETQCRYCRLRKCFRAGMRKEGKSLSPFHFSYDAEFHEFSSRARIWTRPAYKRIELLDLIPILVNACISLLN